MAQTVGTQIKSDLWVGIDGKSLNTEGEYYSVSYATFVVPLVNAVKELDAKSENLKAKSDILANENAQLKAQLEKIEVENTLLKARVDKNVQDIEAIKAALHTQ